MSELKRLLDDPSCDFDRVLLESALDDGPPPRSLERTLAALGVAGAVAAIGAEAVGAAAVGGAAEAAVGAAGASTIAKTGLGLTLAKWLGVVAVSGAVSYAVYTETGSTTQATPRDVSSPSVVTPPATDPASAQSPSGETQPADGSRAASAEGPSQGALQAAASASAGAAPGGSTSRADRAPGAVGAAGTPSRGDAPLASARAGTLSDEVAAIDAASRALASGDVDAALAKLAAYRARFPAGQLAAEAAALRVQALAKKGDKAAADREAAAFKASYPGDPQETRVDEATRAR